MKKMAKRMTEFFFIVYLCGCVSVKLYNCVHLWFSTERQTQYNWAYSLLLSKLKRKGQNLKTIFRKRNGFKKFISSSKPKESEIDMLTLSYICGKKAGCRDIQHSDTHHNVTLNNGTQHTLIIMAFCIKTLSIMVLCIITLIIMTLYSQHFDTQIYVTRHCVTLHNDT